MITKQNLKENSLSPFGARITVDKLEVREVIGGERPCFRQENIREDRELGVIPDPI